MDPGDKTILLYNGRGADKFCVDKTVKSFEGYLGARSANLVLIDASNLTESNFKGAKAIVIPGGNAAHMRAELKAEGIEKICNFVSDGGSYIGFCAGAYLAGPHSYYNLQTNNFGANLISCQLESLPVELRGHAQQFNETTARAVCVKNESNEEYYAFWNGGGQYPWYNPGFHHSLAWYSEQSCTQSAVLYSCEKRRTVVVSNIHPEIQLTDEELDTFPNINKKDFLASATKQRELFSRICDLADLGTKKVSLW